MALTSKSSKSISGMENPSLPAVESFDEEEIDEDEEEVDNEEGDEDEVELASEGESLEKESLCSTEGFSMAICIGYKDMRPLLITTQCQWLNRVSETYLTNLNQRW